MLEEDGLILLVAENIRAIAGRAGISQSKLAKLIGMHQRTLADRWWGRIQWQLEDLEKVSKVFGTPASTFLEDTRTAYEKERAWRYSKLQS
jgi:transcriptional regulator with XRE-family HTH domain